MGQTLSHACYVYSFSTYYMYTHILTQNGSIPKNPFFTKPWTITITLVFFQKWSFHIEILNCPYFARIYVYTSRSYTAKTSVIACLVFMKIQFTWGHTHYNIFTQNTTYKSTFIKKTKQPVTVFFGIQFQHIYTHILAQNGSIPIPIRKTHFFYKTVNYNLGVFSKNRVFT